MAYTWTPDAADVAGLVPNRTQDASRSFTTTTYPTLATVEAIIAAVCEEVAAYAGDPDTLTAEESDATTTAAMATLAGAAKRVATFGAASQVEVSYTSSDVKDGGGKAKVLNDTYTEQLGWLRKSIGEFNQGQAMGGVNDVQPARGSFPDLPDWKTPPGFIVDEATGLYGVDPTWGLW